MDEVIGLLFLAGYIAGIVGLAAGITFAVIKIFPTERNPRKSAEPEAPEKPSANSGGEQGGGSLFRRSKRGSG